MLGLVFSPFPHWPSYLYLWKVLLRSEWQYLAKLRLAAYLIGVGLRTPILGFFWCLDELLYREYRQREIRPVFIIGQPRCGTTFLHRTLSADSESFFAVKHIEWRYPSISLQKLLSATGLGSLLMRTSYWPETRHGKLAAKMHPNTLADPEEDGIFFEENYLHHFFVFLRFPDVELLHKMTAFDDLPEKTQQRMLDIHHRCIQKVAFLRGAEGQFYLSKEVTSHNKIHSLLTIYPNARFVVLVRSAQRFLPSLIALMRMSTRSKTGLDTSNMPDWQEAVISHFGQQCKLLVNLCEQEIPADQQLRAPTDAVTKQVVASISRIYQFLALPMSPDFLKRLREIESKQQIRNTGYSYEDLEVGGCNVFERFDLEVQRSFLQELSRGESTDYSRQVSN